MGFRAGRVVAAFVAAVGALPLPSPSSFALGGAVTYDLADAGSHDASILWNVLTDNVTRSDVTAWNSSHLTYPGAPSGMVTVDVDVGTVAGTITNAWACPTDDCDGWTYREAVLTATIRDGRIDEGTVTGSLGILYEVRAGRDEAASDCDGSPCWICADRFCEMEATVEATADLHGSLEGSSLSLSFQDRLEADATQMDLSELTRVEFAMSRFEVSAVPPAATPAPPSTTTEAERSERPASGETGVDTGEATEDGGGGISGPLTAIGLAVAIVLILAWLFPGARGWYKQLFSSILRNLRRRSSPPPPPPPPDPAVKTYGEGEEAITFRTTVEELPPPPPPPPVYEIMGSKESGYEYVEARTDDGSQVYRLLTGTKVEVVTRLEHLALVRPTSGGSPVWVDRRDIQMAKPEKGR